MFHSVSFLIFYKPYGQDCVTSVNKLEIIGKKKMHTLHYAQHKMTLESGQNVLTVLLKHDIAVPHSCEAGACQSCLLQATDGEIPSTATSGVKR